MITDLPHKASSERGRFVGIFRRAEPMKDLVPMITPLLRACSNATKHIHPQPIGWMRARMPSFSQRGSRLPLWPEKKPWQYWGKKSSSGRQEAVQSEMRTDRFEQRFTLDVLPSAGVAGPAIRIHPVHAPGRGSPDDMGSPCPCRAGLSRGWLWSCPVPRAHIGLSSTVPPAAYRPRRDRDKNANRKEKTQGPLPHLQRSVAGWSPGIPGSSWMPSLRPLSLIKRQPSRALSPL